MKKLVLFALILTSLHAFSRVELDKVGVNNNSDIYSLSSSGQEKVTVQVDYAKIRVDCHGPRAAYTKKKLESGTILVRKIKKIMPLYVCRPGTDYIAQTGISFTVDFDNGRAGDTIQLIVPEGAKVVAFEK